MNFMDSVFVECFKELKDPRVDRTKKHLLLDIVAIAVCAVICGAEGWEEIEDFGKARQEWFSNFLELPNGIPSHDTFSRVFGALKALEFQESCMKWFRQIQVLLPETVIAIDGKTLRGSARKNKELKGLHIVNAWSCANGIDLGQLKVDDKSNEITAVPEILKQLEIKGAIVTLDAMGCQKENVKTVVDSEGDYIISLKGNQGNLHNLVKDSFELKDKGLNALDVITASDEIDADHGRIDSREVEVVDTKKLKGLLDPEWLKLRSIIRVRSQRIEANKTTHEERFYISSLPHTDPTKILKAIRSHWQVENNLHWSLDVTFREDQSRIRQENAAINYSWMRKFALGLLKKETSVKMSIRRKQRKALIDPSYLTMVVKEN